LSASNDNSRDVLPPRHILEDRLANQLVRIARAEAVLTMTRLALDGEHSEPTEEVCGDVFSYEGVS